MKEIEINRRRMHGVLSSKSLLESLEALTINKPAIRKISTSGKSSLKSLDAAAALENPLIFRVNARNHTYMSIPDSLIMNKTGN